MWIKFKTRLTEAINAEDEWGNPTETAIALAWTTLITVYLYRLVLMAIFVSAVVWVITKDYSRFLYDLLF